ncbi:MAG: hypothetical protein IJQ48_09540, partial [Prevotella sp.]|nr:hypothetical protein [Prevotella sp.]
KEDSRISAAEDRGRYLAISITFVFYLLLSSSISLYLQGIQSLRNFSEQVEYFRNLKLLIIGNYRLSKLPKEAKESIISYSPSHEFGRENPTALRSDFPNI